MIQPYIEQRSFGKTHQTVTCVGLGGEGVLRTHSREQEAAAVLQTAIDQGITYFDSARVYADSELYYGTLWGKHPEIRATLFQASKSASRDKIGAMADLKQSLKRLQTDYLDLWQIHDIRTAADIAMISADGGALEAFVEARSAGRVRAIGVTGHHDPGILTEAVQRWPVDVSPVDGDEAKDCHDRICQRWHRKCGRS